MTNIIRQSFVHPGGRPPAPCFAKGAAASPQDAVNQNLPFSPPQQLLHGPNSLRSSSSCRPDNFKANYSLNGPPEIGPSLWLYRGGVSNRDDAHHLPSSTCGKFAAADIAEECHADTKETESNSATAAPSNILQSLLGNSRLGSIRDMLGELDIFSPDRAGGRDTLTVTVTSAIRLDSRQVEQIKRKMRRLTGFEDLRVSNTVDPSLIAGFVIRYEGSDDDDEHVIDLSVKGQLANLQARIETSEKRREEQEQGWTLPS